MEHLVDATERAELHDAIRNTPTIPWLGFDHDMTAHQAVFIDDYPLQRNWTRDEILTLESGEVPSSRKLEDALCMIQSWLFFGLLESAFGTRFRTCDYVRNLDGKVVMDTTKLRECIDNYHANVIVNQALHSVLEEQREAMVKTLVYAADWNSRLGMLSHFEDPLASDAETFTQISRLSALVAEAVWAVGQQFPSPPETRFFIDCRWLLEPRYEHELKERVTARGWCPTLFDRINNFARLPASFLEYMSIRPCLKLAQKRHQECGTRCLEYNISDLTTYQALHREPGCKCSNVSFPKEDIEAAFAISAIPVVDGDQLLASGPDSVIRWTPIMPLKFVTFSHVWSDGLGSDTETGLPTCQVQHLRDLAVEATGTPYFWLDSLCIPRRADLRKTAISRMSQSYRSSYATIVLDAGIQHTSSAASYQAQLLAVSLSTWQERLWTLSESVLSTRLLFAFSDRLIPSKPFLDAADPQRHLPVIRIATTLLDNISQGMHSDAVTIGALQRNAARRTSSYADDEPLALATIMREDLTSLLDVEGDERRRAFWLLARHVPRSIIIETSPKLPIDGFRWAPRSLMDLKCDVMLEFQDSSATVTEEGLQGRFWLYRLVFASAKPWTGELTFTEARTGCCFQVSRHESVTGEYTVLPGDVVCFTERVVVGQQPSMGVLLRPLPPGEQSATRSGDGEAALRRYRYGALAVARLDPFASLRDMPEGIVGGLVAGLTGWMGRYTMRADEEESEIVIY